MDEATLIAAARSGDGDAFTELYQKHIGYVTSVGRATLRKSDVDDMCQDTFLVAFTKLHAFQGNSLFRTWVGHIALNLCLMTLQRARQASNGESHLVQIDPAVLASDALEGCFFACADKNLEGVAARLDLPRLLRVLKPDQRRVLEMAYLEGIPDQEIAKTLGLSHACVKSKIYHAKQRVRQVHKKR